MEAKIAAICIAKIFMEQSPYTDDDTETLELIAKCITAMSRAENHRQICKTEDYVENIIPSLSSMEFKSHFRMLPCTFELILKKIGGKLIRTTDGNRMIAADKQLLLSLWRFATPDSYRSIIQRFDVGKATAIRAVRRVAKALCEILLEYIKWPTEIDTNAVVRGFSSLSGFPDAIGAIGGTHVRIPAPNESAEARKGHHSIYLQAVCDSTRKFTHVYIRHAGCAHDTNVPYCSALEEYIDEPTRFPNNTHLIGDAAYELHQHLLTPYTDNGHLTKRQKNYNYSHSAARMVIERAFALLKGRWRSLLNILTIHRTDFTPYHILACCVLHNICLLNDDHLHFPGEVILVNVENAGLENRRVHDNDRTIAEAKRNRICANLRKRNIKSELYPV